MKYLINNKKTIKNTIMKQQLFNNPVCRYLFLLAIIMSLTTGSFATVHTVSVADFSFSPSGFTAHVGDTVKWVWVSGTHTTTSTTKPSAAARWNQPIDSGAASFSYRITALGMYHYQCTFHVSMGMIDSFNVVPATGIESPNSTPVCTTFPNPASGTLNVQLCDPSSPASVTIRDITGREWSRSEFYAGQNAAIDLKDIPSGLYFMQVVQGGMVYDQKLTIAH
jgi:plastocyanin